MGLAEAACFVVSLGTLVALSAVGGVEASPRAEPGDAAFLWYVAPLSASVLTLLGAMGSGLGRWERFGSRSAPAPC